MPVHPASARLPDARSWQKGIGAGCVFLRIQVVANCDVTSGISSNAAHATCRSTCAKRICLALSRRPQAQRPQPAGELLAERCVQQPLLQAVEARYYNLWKLTRVFRADDPNISVLTVNR
jgi:hypothetical protein